MQPIHQALSAVIFKPTNGGVVVTVSKQENPGENQ